MKAIWLIAAAISGAGLVRGYDFISDTHCHSLPGVAETLRKVRAFAERLGDTTTSAEGCSSLNGLAGDKVDAWG
jgi:hypothetical protein